MAGAFRLAGGEPGRRAALGASACYLTDVLAGDAVGVAVAMAVRRAGPVPSGQQAGQEGADGP